MRNWTKSEWEAVRGWLTYGSLATSLYRMEAHGRKCICVTSVTPSLALLLPSVYLYAYSNRRRSKSEYDMRIVWSKQVSLFTWFLLIKPILKIVRALDRWLWGTLFYSVHGLLWYLLQQFSRMILPIIIAYNTFSSGLHHCGVSD